ncbi:ParA family partition ATPase [Tranquillimonas alkanivorans]|uniref:Chromosome partitioning protein n=1 Tax=Tranquillimonas alkanivorans TaxID=441119 RepID=A0A1I5PRZ7_9RHOB|nr:ParA family partition ATPase [Tranquillimonas alkanivorans]SFP36620.1 chromosome partitioning protein [Tranquillimonas alkanivorans]
MGHVLTLAQQKGGAGKTTLAVNLACAAREAGLSVALLDTDPQGSLGRWFMARRERLEAPGFDFATASAWGVSYECEKLRKVHDLVVVDTPPKVDADLRPALREASLVLVPVAVSHLDLWAVESVLDLTRREGRPARIVLNRAAPRARLTDRVERAVAELDAGRANTIVRNRVIYAEALGDGSSALERKRTGPAADEVRALWSELSGEFGG